MSIYGPDPLHDMRQEARRMEREDDTEALRRERLSEQDDEARRDAREDERRGR